MMKFLVASAMLALIGFSLTSAAAIDLDDDNIALGEMDDFNESLQNLLDDVSQQIKENPNLEDASDVESFLWENQIDGDQVSFLTEEEKEEFTHVEPSDVEDDQMGENVESGRSCRWTGQRGTCCKGIRIPGAKIKICLVAVIKPPTSMEISITLGKKTIWKRTVVGTVSKPICGKIKRLRVCFNINKVHISAHSAAACLSMTKPFKRRILCFSTHFADDEITRSNEETPLQLSEKEQNINDPFFVSNEN